MAAYLATTRKDRNTGFSKHGSKVNGTDGAHKCSHRVADGILSHARGRGGHGTGAQTSGEALSGCVAVDLGTWSDLRSLAAMGFSPRIDPNCASVRVEKSRFGLRA